MLFVCGDIRNFESDLVSECAQESPIKLKKILDIANF